MSTKGALDARSAAALPAIVALLSALALGACGRQDTLPALSRPDNSDRKAHTLYVLGMKLKRREHYREAARALFASLHYAQTSDTLLALGQIDLALGIKGEAAMRCRGALALKPGDEQAAACLAAATGGTLSAPEAPSPPSPPAAAPP